MADCSVTMEYVPKKHTVKVSNETYLKMLNIQTDLMVVCGKKYSFEQILQGLISDPIKRGIALKKIKAMIEAD